MSAESVTVMDPQVDGDVECWCCGVMDDSSRLVHLGNHPEVQLCLGCAHFVHLQAWEIEDSGRRGLAGRAREAVRTLRAVVMRRGWHRNKIVGGALRWLGRYLP